MITILVTIKPIIGNEICIQEGIAREGILMMNREYTILLQNKRRVVFEKTSTKRDVN